MAKGNSGKSSSGHSGNNRSGSHNSNKSSGYGDNSNSNNRGNSDKSESYSGNHSNESYNKSEVYDNNGASFNETGKTGATSEPSGATVVNVGNMHNMDAEVYDAIASSLKETRDLHPKTEITVSLELPPEYNALMDTLAAGGNAQAITDKFFEDTGIERLEVDYEALQDLAVTAAQNDVTLIGSDVVPSQGELAGGLDERLANDKSVYGYLESQGHLEIGDITIVQQGAGHLTGSPTSGFDDIAAANGHDVTTTVVLNSNPGSYGNALAEAYGLTDEEVQDVFNDVIDDILNDPDQADTTVVNGQMQRSAPTPIAQVSGQINMSGSHTQHESSVTVSINKQNFDLSTNHKNEEDNNFKGDEVFSSPITKITGKIDFPFLGTRLETRDEPIMNGNDTFMISATEKYAFDRVQDFKFGQDVLEIKDILVGYDNILDGIENFINISHNHNHIYDLNINADGQGNDWNRHSEIVSSDDISNEMLTLIQGGIDIV